MAGIGSTYDPPSTAQALAEQFTSGRQTLLTRQSTGATAASKGLTTLNSAMSAFQTKLLGLTSAGKTLTGSSAVFSDTTLASATANAAAAAGTYSFFVESVASAHKVSYSSMTDFPGGGSMDLDVGGVSFNVDLTTKPVWTVRELAAAINGAADNTTLSASVVTTGGTSELVLTSKVSGSANVINVTANNTDAGLAAVVAAPNQLASALDAVLRVGSETGTAITQSSNTFEVIDGVTINVTKAQLAGTAPVSLTIGTDKSATLANVQSFVDAYNELTKTVGGLTNAGDPASGGAPGVFAGDSGVRALRDRLVGMLRVSSGGVSLANYGIVANRDGTLSVNSSRLHKTLESNPSGLDTLIGSSAIGSVSGIAGSLDTYLEGWTDVAGGQIASRKEAVSRLQDDLATRQTMLDKQYDSAYSRYLDQFSRLQAMQSQMSYNTSLFDSLFGSDSKD